MDLQSDRMRVVLLDDDEDFRHALAENLREDGYEVLEYADPTAVESLDLLANAAVVVTDYAMEKEDGLTFAARVHACHPTLAIAIATSYPTPQLEARITRSGYLTLLHKPLAYTTLQQWIEDQRATGSR